MRRRVRGGGRWLWLLSGLCWVGCRGDVPAGPRPPEPGPDAGTSAPLPSEPLARSFPFQIKTREPDPAQQTMLGRPVGEDAPSAGPPPEGWPSFVDAAEPLGVRFTRFSGGSGRKYSCEPKGGGLALLDADGDGWTDLYLLDGGPLPGTPPGHTHANRLFRNLGGQGFEDVSARAGAPGLHYDMGAATGDFNGDGHVDLFVTSLDGTVLYRNRGDGTFTDVTTAAGAFVPGWSSAAVFVDLDEDGWPDLYVTRYLQYHPRHNPPCYASGVYNYCTPHDFPPLPDVILRNVQGQRFEDVTARWLQPAPPVSMGLMVAAGDLTGDGHVDLYVANDEVANFLLVNDGQGRLRDEALFRGVAVGGSGIPEAGMGVDLGDIDGDRSLDLVVGNFSAQAVNDYRNDGQGIFTDWAERSGIFNATYLPLKFGVRLFDADNDGDLDLFTCHGHIWDTVATFQPGMTFPQQNSLLRNDGGRFTDLSSRSGPGLLQRRVARGVVSGDPDQDGDLDLVYLNQDSPVVILRNDGGNRLPWLQVRLEGRPPNTQALGARVELEAGGRVQLREVTASGGYQSSNELVLHFGLGPGGRAERLKVTWPPPRRKTTIIERPPANQRLVVREAE